MRELLIDPAEPEQYRRTKQVMQAVMWWVRAALMLAGAVWGVGVTFGSTYRGLPAQTFSNTTDIAASKIRITDLERVDREFLAQGERDRMEWRAQNSRMICLLAMPEDARVRAAANPFVLERECAR